MEVTPPTAALIRLLVMLRRSFVQFLRFAHPYNMPTEGEVADVLGDILADQDLMAERVAAELEAAGVAVPNVEFPLEFTDAHDLSIDYLLQRCIRYLNQDLATLRGLSGTITHHATYHSLVDEAVGMTQAHLEALEECVVVKG